MKVLIVEDDALTRQGLTELLQREGYDTVALERGEEALAVYDSEHPDLICLDIMLPGQSGYDLCRAIRARDTQVPIIFISAKSEEIDKVLGLELGADDFIVKPFGIHEVAARIRAVTRRCFRRRSEGDTPRSFRLNDLEVLPDELRARRGEQVVDLSLREVRILELFHQNRGVVLERERLFTHCWGQRYLPRSRTLDQHISKLRKRIERDPQDPSIIRTVHGVGYRFDPDPTAT